MPGLPRPRLARVLRRRNRSDRTRQRYALDLGALLALVCVIAAKWFAAVVVVAIAALPRLARAIAAEMSASLEPDEHATPAIRATQEAALSGAELARVGLSAAMDGVIDEHERGVLRTQSSRCRKALDALDSALARAEKRGVA